MTFQQWFNISQVLIHVVCSSTFAVDLHREDPPEEKGRARNNEEIKSRYHEEIIVKNIIFSAIFVNRFITFISHACAIWSDVPFRDYIQNIQLWLTFNFSLFDNEFVNRFIYAVNRQIYIVQCCARPRSMNHGSRASFSPRVQCTR